ncbi:HopJ type III effector protein [uncultured Dokdonia sp.]|uniref:HopJ type III effector protein n=1 Tax=uncultured Dokdonia sp. TaxID=575653 RepID=UPI0030EE472D|tara:strand:+ start:104872 stop:105216 length:345 start_codon:yes stop_codon:yes gene_type:complete
MTLQDFKTKLATTPSDIQFTDTMEVIESLYTFTPSSFTNGDIRNDSGENNGSCKLFGFAKDQGLNKSDTLHCFGAYYREDVLQNPEGTDHQNIRNFMQHGWEGISFDANPLHKK